MPIDVTCPKCNLPLPAPDAYAGKKIRCAECNTIVDVPAPGASTIDLQPAPVFAKRRPGAGDEPAVRTRRQPRDPGTSIAPLTIGAAGLALVVVAGALFLVFGGSEKKDDPAPAPVPVPIVEDPTPKPPVPEKPTPTKPTTPTKPAELPVPTPMNPSFVKGLRFHLTFDTKTAKGTYESIAGRSVGTIADGAELVPGKRGRALKVPVGSRATAMQPIAFGVDLTDVRDRLTVAEKAAFTVCVWADSSELLRSTSLIFLGQDKLNDRPRANVTATKTGGAAYQYFESSDSTFASFTINPGSNWHHFALRRTSTGTWSVFIDGNVNTMTGRKAKTVDRPAGYAIARAGLAASALGTATANPAIAFDDFCYFDRDLTNDEIAKLAGKD